MNSCALCSNTLSSLPIIDGKNEFCCAGCHAVFNVLSSKNQLENYQHHPLFEQALRAGLISNPALLEEIRRNRIEIPENQLQKLHLEIGEMWCPSCADIIRLLLLQQRGVRNCVIDYSTDFASIEFSPLHLAKEQIFDSIKSFGYNPLPLDAGLPAVSSDLHLRFLIAAFCSLNIMMFASPIYASYFDYDFSQYSSLFAWLSLLMSVPVIGYSAMPILKRFWTSLQVGMYGMETLVVIGVSTAFGLSIYNMAHGSTEIYFDSLTVVITFLLLGKIIEARAKFSAKNAMKRLVHALPRRGRKQQCNGSYEFVSVKEICSGDLIKANSGEKIVCDGIVIDGDALVDESLMTGEMLPIRKNIDSTVIGGSIVQNGSIIFRATQVAEGSTLHKIVEMVQQEIGHKSQYVRAADPIVRWFVPIVMLIAAVTVALCLWLDIADGKKTVIETGLIRAISVLLISCPCAIGIAVPLAESYLINGLAALGAIVRNRGALALLGREDVIVFDKTGTITEGCFTVLRGVENLNSLQRSILKGLTSYSNHLISRAIFKSILEQEIHLIQVEEIAGKGLRGTHNNTEVHLGSLEFLQSQGVTIPHILDFNGDEDLIHSSVCFAIDKRFVTFLILGDRLREGVAEVITGLAPATTILLSGDTESVVADVAKRCGFQSWKSRCSPLEKREFIEKLRLEGHCVCMLGDGINDAPALTSADIGISMVSATDLSIQVSDLLLTTDRLQVLPRIGRISMKGHRIIKENLFWAFFYNVIGIGLAAGGLLTPIFASVAMVMSSLFVVFNAKRVRSES